MLSPRSQLTLQRHTASCLCFTASWIAFFISWNSWIFVVASHHSADCSPVSRHHALNLAELNIIRHNKYSISITCFSLTLSSILSSVEKCNDVKFMFQLRVLSLNQVSWKFSSQVCDDDVPSDVHVPFPR